VLTTKPTKPIPRTILTVEEGAKLIALMEKASKDMRLTKDLRLEATQGVLVLRRIQARKTH